MRYAPDESAGTLALCHPELRQLLADFDSWSTLKGMPEVYLTQSIRDRAAQIHIYVSFWMRVLAVYLANPQALSMEDTRAALAAKGKTTAQLESMAGSRFTWHYVRCAADLRTRHYSTEQLTQVEAWFRERCQPPLWLVRVHDVHGPHLHVERKDFAWRQRYSPPQTAPPGGPNAA